jgi:riboflavin biosynthesis pyrimidine reductase
VLTEQVDGRYLSYLKSLGISYVIAGEREIDVPQVLRIIGENLAPKFYLLEGGSIINGYFLRADCVDELSLVVSPITADKDSKPLFMNVALENFTLISQEQKCGALVQKHKKM